MSVSGHRLRWLQAAGGRNVTVSGGRRTAGRITFASPDGGETLSELLSYVAQR